MVRHFSVNKQSSSAIRGWQHFTELDWLHFFGRFLVCLFFLHSVLWNLSQIDTVTAQLIGLGCPPDLALPAILAAIAVAFVGSALFFTASDPPSFYLLLLFLLPHIVSEHVLPMMSLKPSSAAFHAHVVSILQSLAVVGGLLVIYTYTQHIEWLEGERKVEIRRALEEWYEKQEGKEGKEGKKGPGEAEQKREPKKVK